MTLPRLQFWIYLGIGFAMAFVSYALESSFAIEALIALGVAFLLARDQRHGSRRVAELTRQLYEARGATKHVMNFADQETARANKNWQAFEACRDKYVPKDHPGMGS